MRTRARSSAAMNEGPVAMGLGLGESTPAAAAAESHGSLSPLGLTMMRAEAEGEGGESGGAPFVPTVSAPAAAAAGGIPGGYGCPTLRVGRDWPHEAGGPAGSPWGGPGPAAPRVLPRPPTPPRGAPLVAPIVHPVPPLPPPPPPSLWSAHALRRLRERGVAAALSSSSALLADSLSRSSSPSSMPPLEEALSSFDDYSSALDMFESTENEEESDGEARMGSPDLLEREETVSAPEPQPEPVVRVASPQPQRQSSRHAARVATARISAAIATGGMVDFNADTIAGATTTTGTTTTTGPATRSRRKTNAVAARPAAASAPEDDDEDAPPPAAAARPRPRRRAGPKTTGESPSPPPVQAMNTRRSGGRKRATPAQPSEVEHPKVKAVKLEPKEVEDELPAKTAEELQNCCICLEVPERHETSKLSGCEHHYCFSCIEKWADRENTCPQCKKRFTKIERVHRPPPVKRRKKGDVCGSATARVKNTKRVKNRDQRSDIHHGNPLQGLFATMEASGTMPPSIAQLIFSGLGGINTGGLMTANRTDGTLTGRVTHRSVRFGGPAAPGHHGSEPAPLQPAAMPLGAMMRRLSAARQDGPAGATAATASSPYPLVSFRISSEAMPTVSARPTPAPMLHLQESWNPPGAASYQPPHTANAAAAAARAAFSSHDDDSDEEGYGSFVQRVQQQQRERGAHHMERFGIAQRRGVPPAPPPAGMAGMHARPFMAAFSAAGNTAETALEIDDDSDDEVIEVIEVPGN